MSLSTLLDRSEVFFFPTFATTEYLLRRRFGFFGGDDGCGESSTTTCCSILFFIFSPNVAADDRKPIKKIHVYIYTQSRRVARYRLDEKSYAFRRRREVPGCKRLTTTRRATWKRANGEICSLQVRSYNTYGTECVKRSVGVQHRKTTTIFGNIKKCLKRRRFSGRAPRRDRQRLHLGFVRLFAVSIINGRTTIDGFLYLYIFRSVIRRARCNTGKKKTE